MSGQIGQKVGNYRLLRLLGQGSFGSVYLAEHLHLQTQAAVKLLNQQVDAHEREAFLQEGRTIASLKHAHILRVLDFGFEQGMPYLVTEYAPNGTLRQKYPRGTSVPVDMLLLYTQQIAQGLQAIHDRELIHRDIKPENVLFDKDEQIVLSDFGIALQGSHQLTEKNIAGTATYMAPEQFQGKPRRASDQYALGIMVYEWLTGKPPFQGNFYGLAGQHISAPVPLEQIPAEVAKVVGKALEKLPENRFPTVTAFAEALQQAINSEQSKKYPGTFNTQQDYATVQKYPGTSNTQQDYATVQKPVMVQSTRLPSPITPANAIPPTLKASPLPRYGFLYALISGILAGSLIYIVHLSVAYSYLPAAFYLLLWIVICYFAGYVTGKTAIARRRGWITGIAAGLSFIAILVANFNYSFPYEINKGIVFPLVVSAALLTIVPLTFCGVWWATRMHPYYRS